MTQFLRSLRFWEVPEVGRSDEIHAHDVQMQDWSCLQLQTLQQRLAALEAKVQRLEGAQSKKESAAR